MPANGLNGLDRLLEVSEEAMDRQIARWYPGFTFNRSNVTRNLIRDHGLRGRSGNSEDCRLVSSRVGLEYLRDWTDIGWEHSSRRSLPGHYWLGTFIYKPPPLHQWPPDQRERAGNFPKSSFSDYYMTLPNSWTLSSKEHEALRHYQAAHSLYRTASRLRRCDLGWCMGNIIRLP